MSTWEGLRYWSDWQEVQRFLVEQGLVIATGMGDDDDVVLTGRGEELFAVLAAAVRHGAGTRLSALAVRKLFGWSPRT